MLKVACYRSSLNSLQLWRNKSQKRPLNPHHLLQNVKKSAKSTIEIPLADDMVQLWRNIAAGKIRDWLNVEANNLCQ